MKILVDEKPSIYSECLFCKSGICIFSDKECNISVWSKEDGWTCEKDNCEYLEEVKQ